MGRFVQGNAVIGQSGGPTAVINSSLIGALEGLLPYEQEIPQILGSRWGYTGILNEDYVNLRSWDESKRAKIARTTGSLLGSSRGKPDEEECNEIFEAFEKRNIKYFFYIGGNDSADSLRIINEFAKKARYELRCFHIPKTIDNDLVENDHTPGYPSAARYVANEFMGFNNDQHSLPGIHLVKVMGRHAGFLTAASVLGRRDEKDAPHLIYVPEHSITLDGFIDDVLTAYSKNKFCVAAISEGTKMSGFGEKPEEIIKIAGRELYGEDELLPRDDHGHIQLSGLGVDLDWLMMKLLKTNKNLRVRTDRLTYNQRVSPLAVSEKDRLEAKAVGVAAAEVALGDDVDGSITIQRTGYDENYGIWAKRVNLEKVAGLTRTLDKNFYDPNERMATKDFIRYARDFVGSLEEQERL